MSTKAKCDQCQAEFCTQADYNEHLLRVFHLDEEVTSFSSAKIDELFKCPICEVQLLNQQGLSQHIGKQHTKKAKGSYCPLCRKKFKHKYAVRFHVKQVHAQATRVVCPHCGCSIYNKYMLRTHIDKEHCEEIL